MIEKFDKEEERLADLYIRLGLPRTRVLVAICLARDKDRGWTVSEIQEATGLVQPVISDVLSHLRHDGLVIISGRIQVAKGRYKNLYRSVPYFVDAILSVKRDLKRLEVSVENAKKDVSIK